MHEHDLLLPTLPLSHARLPPRFDDRNHSSTTIVNGQSFSEWFKDVYVFDYQGTSPLVSGFYFDDFIPPSGGFPDPFPNMYEDMGLTPALQKQLSDSYVTNMALVYAEVLERGMFSWQQLWKCVRRGEGRRRAAS